MLQHSCYENWTTPYAAASLLRQILDQKIIDEPYYSRIKYHMQQCKTGKDKLAKALEGTSAQLGHNTGSGPQTPKGRTIANNDWGFVPLSNGKHYIIAVFVKDALGSPAESNKLIANISQMVFHHFNTEKNR